VLWQNKILKLYIIKQNKGVVLKIYILSTFPVFYLVIQPSVSLIVRGTMEVRSYHVSPSAYSRIIWNHNSFFYSCLCARLSGSSGHPSGILVWVMSNYSSYSKVIWVVKNQGFTRLSITKKHNWLTKYIFGQITPSLGDAIDCHWHNLPKYILSQSIMCFCDTWTSESSTFTIIMFCLEDTQNPMVDVSNCYHVSPSAYAWIIWNCNVFVHFSLY
jgi:hypothetical protein